MPSRYPTLVLLLLVRHGSTDLTAKQLVGRTRGVHLNAAGRKQADDLVQRLEGVPIEAVYSSPLERAVETATPLAKRRGLDVLTDENFNEVDYGEWAGQEYKVLRRTELWRRVQQRPADARFPGGEAVREAQGRMIAGIEALALARPGQTVAVVSHADMIKAAIAHLLGLHLDMFQRLQVAPASVSGALLGTAGPALVAFNDVGGLARIAPRRRTRNLRGGQN
jgi:probable phosphomutase (TIGR03848 family)